MEVPGLAAILVVEGSDLKISLFKSFLYNILIQLGNTLCQFAEAEENQSGFVEI